MRLHAVVEDLETARAAVEGGATVVQLRLKGRPTREVVERGRPFRKLPATFVVNDDVEAALELGADGVHLGRTDPGAGLALTSGLMLGLSAATTEEARAAQRVGAAYVGAGPVWGTPSKLDADPPLGLGGLSAICTAISIPVIAIGGVDTDNAAVCIQAGASGVAVIRAARDAAALLRAMNEAL